MSVGLSHHLGHFCEKEATVELNSWTFIRNSLSGTRRGVGESCDPACV